MIRDCIDIERRYSTMLKRAGLFDELEETIQRNYYSDAADAEQMALRRANAKKGEQETFEDYQNRFKAGGASAAVKAEESE
jgi:Arc/MetJ-type ribon-helix-helix transcriptional regulator